MLENPFLSPGPLLPVGAVASAGGKRPVESGGTDEPAEKRQKVGITGTWRIIPVSKWLITMVRKSPKWGLFPFQMA